MVCSVSKWRVRWCAWRKFVDVFASQGSAIAQEVIARFALLYAVVDKARGMAPANNVALH